MIRVPAKTWKAMTDRGMRVEDFLDHELWDGDRRVLFLRDRDWAKSEDDGSYAVGGMMEVFPFVEGGVTDEYVEGIVQTLEGMFSHLPDDTVIQGHLMISREYPLLDAWASRKRGAMGSRLAQIRKEFVQHREDGMFEDYPMRPMTVRTFVSIRIPFPEGKPRHEAAKDASYVIERIRTILQGAGLGVRVLSLGEMAAIIREILNAGRVHTQVVRADHPLREQLSFSGIEDDPSEPFMRIRLNGNHDGIPAGYRYAVVVSSRLLPERPDFRRSYIGDVFVEQRKLTYPMLVTVNFIHPNQEKFKGEVQRKLTITGNQRRGILAWFSPGIHHRYEDLFRFKSALESSSGVRAYVTYIVFADTVRQAEEARAKVMAVMKLNGFIPQNEDLIRSSVFFNALPLNFSAKRATRFYFRGRSVTSLSAPHLLPLVGDWKGTKTPVLLYFTRRGELVGVDLFDSQENYNAIISAASGSGKSFFANDIIVNYLAEGARVFAVDVGGSFQKLCESLGGEYVEFDEDTVINPFDLITLGKDNEISPDDLSFLTPLLVKMAAGEDRLDKVAQGTLEEALVRVVEEKGRRATLADVYRFLQENGEHNLAMRIYSFAVGRYARHFTGRTNVDLDKDFVVLELRNIRNQKEIVSVVLLMVLFRINKAVEEMPRGVRKLIVIDEAWDLLQDPYSAKFIENAFRVYRKFGASAIAITQSLSDLYVSEGGRAAAENASWYFLLRQKREGLHHLVQSGRLMIGPYLRLVTSLQTVKGLFSEVFIYNSSVGAAGLVRFVPDPYSYYLFTTHPDDLQAIERVKVERGVGTLEAIEILAREKEAKGR